MNMLQGLDSNKTYCVSLNQSTGIDQDKIIKRIQYHHPVFQPGRADAQANHNRLIRRDRISFCGAYWGYGFHEDGIKSALAVCSAYGKELN
jgi:predicted NAD/FAD-binding protein